jgi:hypothetical protein
MWTRVEVENPTDDGQYLVAVRLPSGAYYFDVNDFEADKWHADEVTESKVAFWAEIPGFPFGRVCQ